MLEGAEGVEEPEVVVVGETQGMLLRYGYEVLLVENGLEVEVKGKEVNPKTKSLTQSMSGSIDFVSMGMGEEVGREIRGVGEEVKTYMMMRGEGVESKIGEGVKERGIKMVGGVGKKIRVIGEEVIVGGYIEYGEGKYESKEIGGVLEVNAKGVMRYAGVGLIGKKEIGSGYVEGVIRVGERSSDSESRDIGIREREGEGDRYESKGMYVGGEIGGGYGMEVREGIGIEIVGRIKIMGVGGEKVKMERGEEVEYEGTKSGKIKVGCVGRYNRDSIIKPYIGMYYEEEVLGEVRGRVYGKELPVSDMKGGSVIGEVGGKIEQGRMRVEVGVKGYGGTRQGVEGMFRLGCAI
jgi:hypothetical protein